MLSRLRRTAPVCADCRFEETDIPVQGGLTLTPRDIAEKSARGMFAGDYSAQPADFGDPVPEGDFSIDPIFERNTDRNTLWEKQEVARRRLSAARGRKIEE